MTGAAGWSGTACSPSIPAYKAALPVFALDTAYISLYIPLLSLIQSQHKTHHVGNEFSLARSDFIDM